MDDKEKPSQVLSRWLSFMKKTTLNDDEDIKPFCQTCDCDEEEFWGETKRREARIFQGEKDLIVFDKVHPGKPGLVQRFTRTEDYDGDISSVTLWRWGACQGVCWTRLEGGGWLVTNTGGQDMFLYPDLDIALLGEDLLWSKESWEHELAIEDELTVCKVVDVACMNGIIFPVLQHTGTTLPRTSSLTKTVRMTPSIPDPYETYMVHVAPSSIPGAGEGLYTNRSVRQGQLVSYYAGVEVMMGNKTDKMSGYEINWYPGSMLDIPEEMTSTSIYCSTIGHKICHSFQPNCRFGWAEHPRFGRIRSIIAIRSMSCGEEVFTNYKYNLVGAPDWFKEELRKYLTNKVGEDKMEEEYKKFEQDEEEEGMYEVFRHNTVNITRSKCYQRQVLIG